MSAPATAALRNRSPRKPRYVQLADDLRAQIMDGSLPVTGFPTESTLCTRYGVSRFTVREALRTLQNEGLIQRRRGSGTIVRPAAARGGALHQPLSNVAEIMQYARDSQFRFVRESDSPLPVAIVEELDGAAPGKWARFRGLRVRPEQARPIALTEVFVHPDLVGVADQVNTTADTVFRQLEQLAHVRVVRVTQDIKAVSASAAIADLLEVSRRSPCLRILRCYIDEEGRRIEISVSYHPGSRFAYSMHIETDG